MPNCFVVFLFFFPLFSNAQVEVLGPVCVLPDIVYDYQVQNKHDPNKAMTLCLRNGKFQQNDLACIAIKSGEKVRIIWSEGKDAAIFENSERGKSLLSINITKPLDPGKIPDSLTRQVYKSKAQKKGKISCPESKGGGCFPIYKYQWEYSVDVLSWVSIRGANARDLDMESILDQPAFYRRRVVDETSGTIKYSNSASVFIEY